MIGRIIAVIFFTILTGCASSPVQQAAKEAAVRQAVVRNPGAILVNPSHPWNFAPDDRLERCGPAPKLTSLPDVGANPITTFHASSGYGGVSQAAEAFTLIVMRLTAAAWAHRDAESQAQLAEMLLFWADREGMTRISGDSVNAIYSANRAVLPILVSYSLLRPALSPEKQERLDAWMKKMVAILAIESGPSASRNNHRILRDSVHMAYGALVGDAGELKIGLDGYIRALGEARADGGLPLELKRGNRAIFYQRHAISSLVTMAEIGAGQGYDLYAADVKGVTLHSAIAFLLDAIDKPDLVLNDAAANFAVAQGSDYRVQDLGFLDARGRYRHYMAWTIPYMARFPGHANSIRLRKFFADGRFKHPMIDDLNGGNMSCLKAFVEL